MTSASPILMGHRGLGRGVVDGHRENTLDSFLAAVDYGLRWIEVDVRRTGDDVLVVAHSPACADGTFYVDMTADEARHGGTLLLDELLSVLPADVGVDLDLKTSMEDALRDANATTGALVGLVARREMRRRPITVTSFDPAALVIVRSLAPDVPQGLLTWVNFPAEHAVAAAAHLDVQFLGIHTGSLGPVDKPRLGLRPVEYVISLVHHAGRKLFAWCPDVEVARRLLDAGADGLCLNDVPATLPKLTKC